MTDPNQFPLPKIKIDPTMNEGEWRLEQTPDPKQEEPQDRLMTEVLLNKGLPFSQFVQDIESVCVQLTKKDNEIESLKHSYKDLSNYIEEKNRRTLELEQMADKLAGALEKIGAKGHSVFCSTRIPIREHCSCHARIVWEILAEYKALQGE